MAGQDTITLKVALKVAANDVEQLTHDLWTASHRGAGESIETVKNRIAALVLGKMDVEEMPPNRMRVAAWHSHNSDDAKFTLREKGVFLRGQRDTDSVDWLEHMAKQSPSGVTLQWVPKESEGGAVLASAGYRVMHRGYISDRYPTVRAVITAHNTLPGATTVLPDGSGFAIGTYPLPANHWLYAEREYDEGSTVPSDLPAPILTHANRADVVAAMQYAIRAATDCGKESDYDPDALVQNAVYALCGPFTE